MIVHPSHLVADWRSHARTRPAHPAVVDLGTGETWSWGFLGEEASRLADGLRALDVGSGSRVALRLPAGPRFIAALWATWACDALWCPLPPSLPASLATERLAHLDPHAEVNEESIVPCPATLPPCAPDAAYLIHTSGSTGAPKGVLVGTAGLSSLWAEQARLFATTAQTRAAWMLSPAFDATVSDIGVVLGEGATLYTVPAGRWLRWKRFAQDLADHGIDQVDAPPSWLALWSDRAPPPSLKTVVAGGEPTPPAILQSWSRRVRWVNVYGPTEATVCVAAEQRVIEPEAAVPATLGRPFPGVAWRVQEPDRARPDGPVQTAGELWLGGDAVALGYWRDPEQTACRFADHDGRRWFRTGDAVRRTDAGWCFEGRLDRQVKRRGQLLHLDGVETVLAACPGVRVVAVHIDDADRLVADIEHAETVHAESLLAWAAARLPAWGVPQRWRRRVDWPRTPSGKVDRLALARGEAP